MAKSWVAGTGNWNVPANWSPASIPTAGEAVNIVFADGVARTVTLDVNPPALGLVSIDLTGAGSTTNTLSLTTSVGSDLYVGLGVVSQNPMISTLQSRSQVHSPATTAMTSEPVTKTPL